MLHRPTSFLAAACLAALSLSAAGCSCANVAVFDPDAGADGGQVESDGGLGCAAGETRSCGTDVGVCSTGQQTCTNGAWSACAGEVGPASETCNGTDDNCDGTVDEGCLCTDGTMQSCGTDVGQCQVGAQTCASGAWGPCAGEVVSAAELCNGLDDDCDGVIDEGCDDDGDGYCDAAMIVVGTPAVCPRSGANTGDDCDDTSAPLNPGATEVCDDLDNNCAAGADEGCDTDGDDFCDGAMTVVGTPAVCPLSPANTADDCDDTAAAINPRATEVCDDLDNNCVAGIDEGCDDDNDNFCDAAMIVVGTPLVCPSSPANTANDCDDATPAINPAATEICTDGIDNNCDRVRDGADLMACPAITVRIFAFSNPMPVAHGRTTTVSASITPADPLLAWTRVWRVTDAQPAATCATTDVTLSAQTNAAASTGISAQVPNLFAKLDCIYTLEVTVNGYARDTARIQMVNARPTVTQVAGATFDGVAWRMFAVAGSTPTLTVTAFDPNTDTPLLFDWSGPDKPRLTCSPTCTSSDATAPYNAAVTFNAALAAGTYRVTLEARDGFDPTPTSVEVIVEVDACVWVRLGSSGTGATPATPMGSIQAALNTARNAAGTSVCVQGGAVYPENLVLPVAPNTPDLYGGFTNLGAIDLTQRPVVEVSIASGVTFGVDHRGKVRHLTLRQGAGAALGAVPTAILTVADASPELLDLTIHPGAGTPPIGVEVVDTAAVGATAAPRLTGSTVQSVALTGANVIGVRSARTTAAPDITLVATSVSLFNSACPVLCRGVLIDRARASITSGSSISVSAPTGSAVGVDFAGVPGTPSTGEVSGSSVAAYANNGPLSVAVRLADTSGVSILNNSQVGSPFGGAGREFAAGIADGLVTRAGVITRGNSSGLTISGNDLIGGGASWWATPCAGPGATGEGADVSAGIFLAGTSGSFIRGNGRAGSSFSGVFGGATTIHWNPATRRLVPSAVGLWLLETSGIQVIGNELRSGSYQTFASCPLPSENPAAIAYRDGMPPNPAFGAGVPGERPSLGTRLDKNGISCARPPENGGAGSSTLTWCVAAELNAPATGLGGAAPVLINNYVAATRGNYCIALRQRGGSGVVAANNTFDSDLILEPFDPPPLPNTIFKWALLLENLAPGGIKLTNNILYTHVDDPYDNKPSRVVIREVVASGTTSRIDTLENNLFYVQYDNVTVPLATYVRITDGVATADYNSSRLNAIAGVATSAANFPSPPDITEPLQDWMKSQSRLLSVSAAIDRGKAVGGEVPNQDIDGDARPRGAGVDIGHDER